MKKVLAFVLILTLALTTLGAAQATTWKLAHVSNTDHNWHKLSLRFAELVKEKTGGSLEIVVYPNSQLGSEPDVLNSIQMGTCDMTMSGESLSAFAPEAELCAAYFAFDNEDHLKRVITGEIGQKIKDSITSAGFMPLMYTLRTPRMLTSNTPISKPEDCKGLRLRLSNTAQAIACWNAVGCNTQVMGLSEVFTALNQGVIDAQENPYDLIYDNSFYEVQKYANETAHVFGFIFFVVGVNQFNALTEAEQAAVLEAAQEAQVYGDELYQSSKDTYKNLLIEKGMQINSDVDRDAFRDAMTPVLKDFFTPDIYALYEEIVASK